MKVSMIWAMDVNRLIGDNNSLPWHLPIDMQWFRKHTTGKPVIMGRNTFDSFNGKPLPNRHNIVVSRNTSYQPEGATVTSSIDEALSVAGDADEVMIIGGSSIYKQTMPHADRLYVTLLHDRFKGDAWFPCDIDLNVWKEVFRKDITNNNDSVTKCSFIIYDRHKPYS